MKAIVQEGYGSADALHLREIDKPVVADGRVLVRVRAASVNALDWHTVHGGFPLRFMTGLRRPTLAVRGSDVAGQVEAVGANVTRHKPGDEVFGTGRGTFAEYATSSENSLVTKPPQVTFEEAAAVGVAGVTALQALRDKGHVQPGQWVLVNGAGGGVGTFAVQIAKALGAHVTAVTGTANVELVRSLGPDEVIDHTKEDFARRGRRYDVVLDVAANRSFSALRRVLAPGGMLVLVGAAKSSMVAMFVRILMGAVRSRVFGQRMGFFMAEIRHDDLVVLTELMAAGKIRPVIDRTYPLSEATEAVRYVGSGHARAKVVVTVG